MEEKSFSRWTKLRASFREAKKARNYPQILAIGQEILDLSAKEPSIGIMDALFLKDMATAAFSSAKFESALTLFTRAHAVLTTYRATKELRSPEDWIREINQLEAKMKQCSAKLAR